VRLVTAAAGTQADCKIDDVLLGRIDRSKDITRTEERSHRRREGYVASLACFRWCGTTKTCSGCIFHAYGRTEGVCGIIITDLEYPKLVAQGLLSKICDEFTSRYPRTAYSTFTPDSPKLAYPELKDYIVKYQDPQQADSIMKIQKELDETKIVLHKTIESVLERGEKIDTLVAKSDGLSAQSKMFYTQVRSQDRCSSVRWMLTASFRQRSRILVASLCEYESSKLVIARRFPLV
jgi:hypothetical protein